MWFLFILKLKLGMHWTVFLFDLWHVLNSNFDLHIKEMGNILPNFSSMRVLGRKNYKFMHFSVRKMLWLTAEIFLKILPGTKLLKILGQPRYSQVDFFKYVIGNQSNLSHQINASKGPCQGSQCLRSFCKSMYLRIILSCRKSKNSL